ncbi:MAG TPA: AAA family ATPase [Candidatus Saccharibacteria bacterium]|nr:AAA family ATPase [Candidatus Saccharibacteria bacterium]
MNISAKPELIGIAGSFASGKDTIAHALEADYGFTHVSTGDMVREAAMRERGSIERPVLFEVADEHRHRDGAGVFVVHALEKPRPLVVTGIRSLGEAKALKAAGGVLLFIDAPAQVRYERMKARHRDAETELTFEQFEANEAKEWHSGETDADFNLRDIKVMADVVMHNVVPLEEFITDAESRLNLAA